MSIDMNNVQLIGRLANDPEYKETSSGTVYAKFSVAVGDYVNKEEKVYFFNCTLFGKMAENMQKWKKSKGCRIGLDGKLLQNKWTDRDGTKKSMVEILCGNVYFLDQKKTNTDGLDSDDNQPSKPVPTHEELMNHTPGETPNYYDQDPKF